MVYSANEWDPLIQVIVGTSKNMFWPDSKGTSWEGGVPNNRKVPQWIIDENSASMDNFVDQLTKRGVDVLRPVDQDYQKLNGFGCYSPRDSVLIVGDNVIFTPMKLHNRRHEWNAIKPLLPSDSKFIYPPDDPKVMFDAANVIRCNNDLLYLISSTGTREGGEWLQSVLGDSYTVHMLENLYDSSHLDSTIIPIADGTVLLNKGRCDDYHLPDFLNQWEQIWIQYEDIIDYESPLNIASRWMGMNIFTVAPKVCCVDANQTKLIDKLTKLGVEVMPIPIAHARHLLGGHHCTTLDTKRKKF